MQNCHSTTELVNCWSKHKTHYYLDKSIKHTHFLSTYPAIIIPNAPDTRIQKWCLLYKKLKSGKSVITKTPHMVCTAHTIYTSD